MKKLAFLEYTFIFDPNSTWSRGFDFEKDLADFFAAHGLEADVVETTGGTGRRMFFITRIEMFPTVNKPNLVNPPKQLQKDTVKKAFDNLAKGK